MEEAQEGVQGDEVKVQEGDTGARLLHPPTPTNQSNTHRFTVGDNDPSEFPTGQFVVKVQVPLSEEEGSLLVYNKDRTLKGALSRVEGQEELYDKLAREVRKNGFNGEKGFFPAICKRDPGKSEGYKLEINPDQILPVETW